MSFMSREEARQAMIDGQKVRHFNFSSSEYLEMECGRIMTEDGYAFGDVFDREDWMETGWSIVEIKMPETVFEAMQEYPQHFMATAMGRSHTTPSPTNRENHLNLVNAIGTRNWDIVKQIIQKPEYRKPFNGVVVCLGSYSDMPINMLIHINDLEKQDKLV